MEQKTARDLALDNIALSSRAPEKINDLKNRLADYDQKMHQYAVDTISGGDPILHLISEYCQQSKTELHKVEPESVSEKSGYNVETLPVIIRGGFKPMLGLLYHMEQIEKKGRIASISFIKINDPKIRKEVLELKVYIQTIQTNE